jgi:hypothetical protein
MTNPWSDIRNRFVRIFYGVGKSSINIIQRPNRFLYIPLHSFSIFCIDYNISRRIRRKNGNSLHFLMSKRFGSFIDKSESSKLRLFKNLPISMYSMRLQKNMKLSVFKMTTNTRYIFENKSFRFKLRHSIDSYLKNDVQFGRDFHKWLLISCPFLWWVMNLNAFFRVFVGQFYRIEYNWTKVILRRLNIWRVGLLQG